MKMLIIEAADLATVCTKFNASPEAATMTDIIEYGITDRNGQIDFVLFYK